AAADAHRAAIEAFERRYTELEGEFGAANDLASEAATERDALAATLETERHQSAATLAAERQQASATLEAERQQSAAARAAAADAEGEFAAATALTSEVAGERDALAATLEEERQEAAAEREAAHDAHRAAIETLERRVAALEGDYQAAHALAAEVSSERDALTA